MRKGWYIFLCLLFTACSTPPAGYRTIFSLDIGGTFVPPSAHIIPTWTLEPISPPPPSTAPATQQVKS